MSHEALTLPGLRSGLRRGAPRLQVVCGGPWGGALIEVWRHFQPAACTPLGRSRSAAADAAAASTCRSPSLPCRERAREIVNVLGRFTSHAEAGVVSSEAGAVRSVRRRAQFLFYGGRCRQGLDVHEQQQLRRREPRQNGWGGDAGRKTRALRRGLAQRRQVPLLPAFGRGGARSAAVPWAARECARPSCRVCWRAGAAQ